MGKALCLERNKRCVTLSSSLTLESITAGPAQYANTLCSGTESNALLELVVVPMTDFKLSCQPFSISRLDAMS